jgi:hypothetical protein
MPLTAKPQVDSFQAQFHQRWNHLNDPHVRALAWLLDSPDVLDTRSARWDGRIATLADVDSPQCHDWLSSLDREPGPLHRLIDEHPTYRLGRYAEKLMAFYFKHRGILAGHNMQVQDGKNGTVGEFDFLLHWQGALLHWEFATKFYLLEPKSMPLTASNFVGPNLADTLAAKMKKILDQQLLLAQHPSSQIHLSLPVNTAKALVKGWLFYQNETQLAMQTSGISSQHCHGFWCTLSEWKKMEADQAIILPKLQWLAPAKIESGKVLNRRSIDEAIRQHFEHDNMPLMISLLAPQGEFGFETSRGFIVADDWPQKAKQYVDQGKIAESLN